MMPDRPRRHGEDVIAWAYETGRFEADRAAYWRQRLADDPSVEGVIEGLTPVDLGRTDRLAQRRSARPNAAIPARSAVEFARNPLVDQARADNPGLVSRALALAPAPTLFQTGDLPPFTASGIDPNALLSVVWQARHPIAATPDSGQAYRLLEEYGDPAGAMLAAMDLGGHAGNQDYERRVRNWLGAAMTENEIWDNLGYPQTDTYRAAMRDPAVPKGRAQPQSNYRRVTPRPGGRQK